LPRKWKQTKFGQAQLFSLNAFEKGQPQGIAPAFFAPKQRYKQLLFPDFFTFQTFPLFIHHYLISSLPYARTAF
jgi:hypothetical protein